MKYAIVILLAACGHKAGEAQEDEEAPPAHVTCTPVTQGPIDDVVVLHGEVAPPPLADAVIASTVAGRIVKLNVQEGDAVSANQLVAVMEDPSLGATATESGADVAGAQATLRGATADRVRIEKLVSQGLTPQKELDAAKATEDAARAALQGAEARAGLAHRQLSRTDLHAPHAGTVLHVMKRAGEVVEGADTQIIEIADLSTLELRTQVTGGELVGLSVHEPATVTFDALPGVSVPGEISAVAAALDSTTGLGTVRVILHPPPDLHLPVGMPGVAAVHGPTRTGLTVPESALRRSIEGKDEVVACAADKDGEKAEVHEVDLGVRGEQVEIASGLDPGDRVIVDHVLGLEDGQAIDEGDDDKKDEKDPK